MTSPTDHHIDEELDKISIVPRHYCNCSECHADIRMIRVEDAKALIAQEVEAAYQNAIYDVQLLRPVYLIKPDNMAGGDDPMAEKAVAIRNQLRKEIVADLEKRAAELTNPNKESE